MAEKNFFFLTSTHNLSLLKLCLLACNLTWVNSPSIIKYFQLPSNLSDENRRLNLDFWTNRFVNRRLDFNRLPMFLDRFGSRYRSNVTGIIYNNEMADFDIPGHNIGDGISPSPFNFPEPNKRPFSSIRLPPFWPTMTAQCSLLLAPLVGKGSPPPCHWYV